MKPQASDRWSKAQVEHQVDVRSMLFEQKMAGFSEESGKNLAWRNLFRKEPSMPKDADVEISSPILNSPPTKASTETLWGENSARQPTALPRKQTEPGRQATRPAPLADCQKSNAVTGSRRSIRPLATWKTMFRPRSFMFLFSFFFC